MSLHWILAEISVPDGVSNKWCLTLVGDGLGFKYMVFLKPIEVGYYRCFCSKEVHNLTWDLGRINVNDSVPVKNIQFDIIKIISCRLGRVCNILVHRDFAYDLYP